MVFVAFFIAKSSRLCQKSTKRDLSFVSKQDTLFHDERGMIHVVSRRREGEKDAAVLSKVQHHGDKQNKKLTPRQTHRQTTKIRSDQHIQNSNFRFKSRETRPR
jgi:hypothetical protein